MPQLLFFLLRQIGITQHVDNATALYNTIRTDHFGDRHDRGHLHHGNASFFEFGRDRSPAASAGPSSGGEDDRLHTFGFQFGSNFLPQTAAIGDGIGQPGGRHKAFMQLAQHTGFFELT